MCPRHARIPEADEKESALDQSTYVMIKPDAVARGLVGRIVQRFEDAGLKVARMESGTVTPQQAAANYAEHEGKPFYDGLIAYVTSGPVVKIIITGPDAVIVCRKLMGATNPREAAPGTIRGDFGLLLDANIVHGSDSPESAAREISIFFADEA
jgi:nucleoside-diphosphate kinase